MKRAYTDSHCTPNQDQARVKRVSKSCFYGMLERFSTDYILD